MHSNRLVALVESVEGSSVMIVSARTDENR